MTKPAHKENHDEELQEIALREFGKGYNDLNEHQKHQCAGFKGSAHRTTNAAAAVGEGKEEGAFAVAYVPAGSPGLPDPELTKFAMETYGKPYAELAAHEKHVVGGKKGSSHARGVHSPTVEQ